MRKYYKLLILFGLVSLFADITYEGSRGVLPTYLAIFGASATLVGLVLGLSELLGYIIRFPFGKIADMTKRYWFFAGIGYFINLISVPLLALANRLELAVLLIFLERIGKGIRSPSREVLLSNLSTKIPIGRVFGIHEMLDQIGAITGPLIASIILYINGSYRSLFLILFLPAITSLIMLLTTYISYDIPIEIEHETGEKNPPKISKVFIFSLGVGLSILALVHYSIILYASGQSELYVFWMVPMLYLLIMGIDGAVSPLLGELYMRYGLKINTILPIASLISTVLFTMQTQESILASAIFAGIAIGVTESTAKSAISDLSKDVGKGTSFGIFYTILGTSSMLAGFIYGYMYDVNMLYLAPIFSLVTAIVGLILMIKQK